MFLQQQHLQLILLWQLAHPDRIDFPNSIRHFDLLGDHLACVDPVLVLEEAQLEQLQEPLLAQVWHLELVGPMG